MASTTANLGLTLPAVSDPADIGALNENFKKIDALGGYGLGGSAVSVNDLNTALNCGFFCWSSDCLNAPFGYGMGITINRFNGRYTQLLFNPWMGSYGEIVVRHYNGTEWIPVEWVNPPMSLGVEYRTTERWNGKPVYTKLLNCGKAVNGGDALLGLDRTCVIIRQAGTAPDAGLVLPYGRTSTSQLSADLAVNSGVWHAYFAVSEGYDGKFDVYLQLWYTKE